MTLITTVKNEEGNIEEFLNSILIQTKKPDEIIIVDGGSKDNTIQLLSSLRYKKLKFKIFKKNGNRSVGRNYGIKKSSHEIILVSDVGCILDKKWVELISQPFTNKKIQVVSGFYKPKTDGYFEKSLAAYTCTMPDKLDKKNFLPSSRSVAFRKSAWEEVGGYPEELDTCEDLVFARNLKRLGLLFYIQEKAFVLWRQRKNITEAAKQFYMYAKGDGQAHYFRKSTPFLFGRYFLGTVILVFAFTFSSMLLFLALIAGLFFYLLWAIQKNFKYVGNIRAIIYLPLLQFTSDVFVILGTSVGFLNSQWRK